MYQCGVQKLIISVWVQRKVSLSCSWAKLNGLRGRFTLKEDSYMPLPLRHFISLLFVDFGQTTEHKEKCVRFENKLLKDLCTYTTYTFIKTPQWLANNKKCVYLTDVKYYLIFNNKIFVNASNSITLYLLIHGTLIGLKVHPIKARPFGK